LKTIMLVYGTRPEAIKMAPIVASMTGSRCLRPEVVVTGQHREMLDQVNSLFGINPVHDLDIIAPNQTLEQITVRALAGLGAVLRARRPDAVVVQGDTTTAFVGALAAFYERIPVLHVEAGLRTSNRYNPFPEEMNRRLTTQMASLHLAPTWTSRANLLAEKVPPATIVVTGNSVIDALHNVVARRVPYSDPALESLPERTVLITAHRRESWGEPMARVASAVSQLAARFADTAFVLPAHLNPVVRNVLLPPLRKQENIRITEPLPYAQFCRLMAQSSVILTDSGGVQEEGPSLGKPVLVMRDTTERPEAVSAGTVRLVGTDETLIVDHVSRLLTDATYYASMATAVNPYGDGQAARRSVAAIEHFFGAGPPADQFDPVLSDRVFAST
jgi:UDP-N-acetylglucosamine 2-epimerase (non-hydrolysing)